MMRKRCSRSMMASWMPMLWWAKSMNDMYWAGVSAQRRAACQDKPKCGKKTESRPVDIVETAVSAGFFTTLVEALEKAGLVDTLRGDGPFTVFAPSDEAFAKIPSKKLESILRDEKRLKQVLTHHVVPGRYTASSLTGIASLKTVEGSPLPVDTRVGTKVGQAHVIQADLAAINGVIHVIDSVLIPDSN